MPVSSPSPAVPHQSLAPGGRGDFLLVACQGGAEAALCAGQQQVLPQLTKGVWRRGVVTFRLPAAAAGQPAFDPPDDFFPDLAFARAVIRSLGQVAGATTAERIEKIIVLIGSTNWDNVHVWFRDPRSAAPAESETDPVAVRAAILTALRRAGVQTMGDDPIARPGDLILDCVIDEGGRWWIGWHRAATPPSCWPGGLYPGALPADKVSRAWLKLDEALATFAVPLAAGERAVELGAAPGGACQRLLESGLEVVGIDPALVDPVVATLSGFTQWRKRARDVPLRDLRGFEWVVADMNIDPTSTLEAVGRVVTAPGSRPRGIIATLKLPEWSRAVALPEWLAQFRAWGYAPQARQLSTGGREVCVAAFKTRASRRPRHATRRSDA